MKSKAPKKVTPTQRSLKVLREAGYLAAIVEHWNQFAFIRQDLFGFVDILCVSEAGTLAVQTTTRSNMNARVKKIRESENLGKVADAGWDVVVHGWKAPSKKVRTWTLKKVDIVAHGVILPSKGDDNG